MARAVGIISISLQEGSSADEFIGFMLNKVFDKAAEAAGVFRGGASMIKSQHLLQSEDGKGYLWVVKAAESLDPDIFSNNLKRMYDVGRKELEKYAIRGTSALYVVSGSFDAGPRTVTGGRLGKEERGDFF